eukprot:3509928-Prymnesium_polylepis.1
MLADFCIAKRRARRHSSSHLKNPARSQHADSGTGPRGGHRQRSDHAATDHAATGSVTTRHER